MVPAEGGRSPTIIRARVDLPGSPNFADDPQRLASCDIEARGTPTAVHRRPLAAEERGRPPPKRLSRSRDRRSVSVHSAALAAAYALGVDAAHARVPRRRARARSPPDVQAACRLVAAGRERPQPGGRSSSRRRQARNRSGSFAAALPPSSGTQAMSRRGVGVRGVGEHRPGRPVSTTRPAYITATQVAERWATDAEIVWGVMNRIGHVPLRAGDRRAATGSAPAR